MNKRVFILFSILLTCNNSLASDMELATEVGVPNPWKIGVSSLYYNFSGHQPAHNNRYSFDQVSYSNQIIAASYQASPTLSYSVSSGYIRNYAETNFFGKYQDSTEGFSDTTIKGTKTFLTSLGIFVADFGVILPTGSISKKNKNAPAANYAYNMQLGSGTYDLMSNLTYFKLIGKHQFGSIAMATIRTGRNTFDYRKGNEYIGKIWYAYQATPYLAPGIWYNHHHIDGIVGADVTYDLNPAARLFTKFYHNKRNFRDLTANVSAKYPINKTLSLSGLVGMPIWQKSANVDDIQVYTRWFAQTGLEATF